MVESLTFYYSSFSPSRPIPALVAQTNGIESIASFVYLLGAKQVLNLDLYYLCSKNRKPSSDTIP